MKIPNRLLASILMIGLAIIIQAQSFETILSVAWNTEEGISTKVGSADNHGVSDFAIINSSTIALLCEAEQKVKIYNTLANKLIREFTFKHYAGNIAYDSKEGIFYLSSHDYIYAYCSEGDHINRIPINRNEIWGIVDIKSEDGYLFIQGPGNTYYTLIDEDGVVSKSAQIRTKETQVLLNNEVYAEYTGNVRNKHAVIKLYKDSVNIDDFDITLKDDSYCGVRPLGITDDYLILEKSYLNKAGLFHQLSFESLNSKKCILEIAIPRIYFNNIQNSFIVDNNSLYQLLPTPDSLHIVRISTNSLRLKSAPVGVVEYPDKFNYEYRFFDSYKDTIQEDTTPTLKSNTVVTDVGMRSEILARAYKYARHKWVTTVDNFPDNNQGYSGVSVNIKPMTEYNGSLATYPVLVASDVVPNETYIGIPYKWCGFTHINTWECHVAAGKIAGDHNKGSYESNSDHVIGVDCSGFVSRVWNLSTKQGTNDFENDGIAYESSTQASEMKKGDILLRTVGSGYRCY